MAWCCLQMAGGHSGEAQVAVPQEQGHGVLRPALHPTTPGPAGVTGHPGDQRHQHTPKSWTWGILLSLNPGSPGI